MVVAIAPDSLITFDAAAAVGVSDAGSSSFEASSGLSFFIFMLVIPRLERLLGLGVSAIPFPFGMHGARCKAPSEDDRIIYIGN